MNHFDLKGGALHCEDVSLVDIAQAVGTPVYVYSTATFARHFMVYRDALTAHPGLGSPLIAYAVKANSNVSVLATLAALGAGADTVSEGEIRRVLAAGVPAGRIVFSGMGKREEELAFALSVGVGQINVESEHELNLLSQVARSQNQKPTVVIRVNPDVGAGGHAKISTGTSANKFGVPVNEARRLYREGASDSCLHMAGLACHIGSQIADLAPLEAAFSVLRNMTLQLRAEGLPVTRLDLGGGVGVPYFSQPDPPTPTDFASMAARVVGDLGVAFTVEPGRVIAANAGVLLTRVSHINRRPDGRRFLVVDAAMNDLLRPAMYEAFHDLRPVIPRSGSVAEYDIVGPVCETGDTFARGRPLSPMQAGDLATFMSAGAYGAVMASEYNTRPLVPEVLVNGADFAVIRPRPSYEDMLNREARAPWL